MTNTPPAAATTPEDEGTVTDHRLISDFYGGTHDKHVSFLKALELDLVLLLLNNQYVCTNLD